MSYKIEISNADISFECNPEQPILDAAHQANILLSYGCKGGICGSCEALIKDGEINYPDGRPKGLSAEEMEQGKVLLCKALATTNLIIEARVEKPESQRPIRTLPVKIQQKNLLADDVMQLILQLPSTPEPFDFLAGQWMYFVMKDGKKRAFSIANTANDKKILEVHVRHANGGVFTDFVFNKLKVGDVLKIEGPQGTFFYHDDFRDIIMVAGGTGFAPLKGIIESLIQQKIQLNIILYWGVRSKKDLYMEELVYKWQQQGHIKYIPVLSEPLEEDNWQGETGFVHEVIVKDFDLLKNYAIYMAGPPQMITASKSAFIKKKAKSKNIYFDSFDYSEDAHKAIEKKQSERS